MAWTYEEINNGMMEPSRSPQSDRFKEAARQLGCDEDEQAFDEKLKGIAGPRQSERETDQSAGKPE